MLPVLFGKIGGNLKLCGWGLCALALGADAAWLGWCMAPAGCRLPVRSILTSESAEDRWLITRLEIQSHLVLWSFALFNIQC